MRRSFTATLAAALLAVSQAVPAAPADEMRALIEAGRSAEAYALGKRSPDELGKADFDFYFGIAATDSGHAGEGVLALERYISQFPDNDRARLELARSYFVLGELIRAREEFETVLRRSPPAEVQSTIERFLDSIRSQESRYTTTASAYVEIGAGYDSNVNYGVGDALVNLPIGTFAIGQAGVQTGDRFGLVGAGVQVSHPVGPGVAVFGGGSVEARAHAGMLDRQFDQQNFAVYGGASVVRDKDLFRFTASYSDLHLDYRSYRAIGSGGVEWHRQLDELNTLSLFGQYAQLDHPTLPVRNADFWGGGVGWRRAFVHPVRPVLQLQALYGQEINTAVPVREDLSRELLTLRAGVSLTPAPRWSVSGALSASFSRYWAPDFTINEPREDQYYSLEAGVGYRLTKDLSARLDYLYSDNRSNSALYEYDRHVVTARLRYEF